LVLGELNIRATDELASADLGTFGVEHEGDMLVRALLEGLIQIVDLLAVRLVVAVGEVETGDIHAGVDHLNEHLGGVAGGAERADDLGAAEAGIDGFEDVVELDVLGVGGYFFHLDIVLKFLDRLVVELTVGRLCVLCWSKRVLYC
jgi:hypothetical protein